MIERGIKNKILKGLKQTPLVFLNGPRQSGKSTLAIEIAKKYMHAEYITFDDLSILSSAITDPIHFIDRLPRPIVLDEVQMAPEIYRSIKRRVDEKRWTGKNSNGQFLLTGSANILALPKLSDAFVGRMQVFTLYPFSLREFYKKQDSFLDILFERNFTYKKNACSATPLEEGLKHATFPQVAIEKNLDPEAWYKSYLSTLLQRDVKNMMDIEKMALMPHLLRLLASRTTGLLNDTAFSRDVGMNVMTLRRYRVLLEQMFLTFSVRPWFHNIGKRLTKTPKLYFVDTFLCCNLLGLEFKDIKKWNPELFGKMIENFVASEILKQLGMSQPASLYHYRTQDNKEIDFMIERSNGDLLALEVKSKISVTAEDFKNIKELQQAYKAHFSRGLVLYLGRNIIPFGDKLYAIPIPALWEL
jgi:predicted AAA+ superfamily ATPase